jgi:hypothetical protein
MKILRKGAMMLHLAGVKNVCLQGIFTRVSGKITSGFSGD